MKPLNGTIAIDHEVLVAEVADQFTNAVKEGQSPSVEEYAQRHPEIADVIRQVFPSLALLDNYSTSQPAGLNEVGQATGVLGDFRILRELGRGGMGVVYEAEQISLGRRVALKVLPFAAMLDKQQLNRFKNEARAAATLDHPNIVSIYSVGAERGVHYYAMQLIEGMSLAEIIAAMKPGRSPSVEETAPTAALLNAPTAADTAKAALSTVDDRGSAAFSSLPAYESKEYFRAIAHLGIQAAEALDHAHQNGILHRDIKPANLLLECNSTPSPLRGGPGRGGSARGLGRGAEDASHLKLWITDFGLARIEQDAGLTMTGDILGTLRYMSPEQALAKRVVVDHRSDIYSLGVTLYELLTLRPAFADTDRSELLKRIAFEEPCALRKVDARIPRELETIIHKSIAKNPSERYATAHNLADDLRAFLEHRPISAKSPSLWIQARKWSRRHRALVSGAVAVLVILGIGSSISTALLLAERERTQLALAESKAVVDFFKNDLIGPATYQFNKGEDPRVSTLLKNAEKNIPSNMVNQPLVEATLRYALGSLYFETGKYAQAEEHSRKALAIRQEHLNVADDDVIDAVDGLSQVLCEDHKFDEAERLVKDSLVAVRDAVGPDHRKTLRLSETLVRVYGSKADKMPPSEAQTAIKFCEQTLALAQRLLGPEHFDTLGMRYMLGVLYLGQGKATEAHNIFGPTLKTCKRVLGPDDVNLTLALMRMEMTTFEREEKWKEAAEVGAEVLEQNRKRYGVQHSLTAYCMCHLARALLNTGDHDRAWELSNQAFGILVDRYGANDAQTIEAMTIVSAALLHHQNAVDCRAAVTRLLKELQPDDWITQNNVAEFLAVTSLQELRDGKLALELAKKACQTTKYQDPVALGTLADAYAESGDFESANKWANTSLKFAAEPVLHEELANHLKSFLAGQPWREKIEPIQEKRKHDSEKKTK